MADGVPANEKFVGIPVRKISEKGTWIERISI